MTVKDICGLIKCAKRVCVSVNGSAYDGWKEGCPGYINDMVDAFGDYVVNELFAINEDCFELAILTKAVRKGDVA